MNIGDDFFHGLAFAVFRIDLEAKGLEVGEQLFLAVDFHADVASQGIGEEGQLALSRNARIELAQRAGRGIAGIGKGL